MLRLVTSPREFLEKRSRNPSLSRTPGGFVVLAAAVSAIEALVVFQLLDPAIASELSVGIVVMVAIRVVETGVIWLGSAFILTALTTLLRGRIDYYRALLVVAWGFPAIVVANAVRVIGQFVVLSGTPQPTVRGAGDPFYDTSIRVQLEKYVAWIDNAASDPLWVVVSAVTLICVLGAGYLWIHGLEQYGEAFDRQEAAISAGVLVLVVAWFLVFQ